MIVDPWTASRSRRPRPHVERRVAFLVVYGDDAAAIAMAPSAVTRT